MARPVTKYDENYGGNLSISHLRHKSYEPAEVFFRKDYVAILQDDCPDCNAWPYQAIFPTLHGKVPLVALFNAIKPCGCGMIENELISQGIIVIARRSYTDTVGWRIGEFYPLPDTLAELLAKTQLVEKLQEI